MSITCKMCMVCNWLLSSVGGASRPYITVVMIHVTIPFRGTTDDVPLQGMVSVAVRIIRAPASLLVVKGSTS